MRSLYARNAGRGLATMFAMLVAVLAGCGTRTRPAQPTQPEVPSPTAATWVPDDGPDGVLAAIDTQQFTDHADAALPHAPAVILDLWPASGTNH